MSDSMYSIQCFHQGMTMEWDPDALLDSVYNLLLSEVQEVSPDDVYFQTLVGVLKRARQAERKPHASFTLLPVLSCVACGGVVERAIPVAAAWRALHIAAHLFDTVQDAARTLSPAREANSELTINTAQLRACSRWQDWF